MEQQHDRRRFRLRSIAIGTIVAAISSIAAGVLSGVQAFELRFVAASAMLGLCLGLLINAERLLRRHHLNVHCTPILRVAACAILGALVGLLAAGKLDARATLIGALDGLLIGSSVWLLVVVIRRAGTR